MKPQRTQSSRKEPQRDIIKNKMVQDIYPAQKLWTG